MMERTQTTTIKKTKQKKEKISLKFTEKQYKTYKTSHEHQFKGNTHLHFTNLRLHYVENVFRLRKKTFLPCQGIYWVIYLFIYFSNAIIFWQLWSSIHEGLNTPQQTQTNQHFIFITFTYSAAHFQFK